MRTKLTSVCLLAGALAASGCATITRGSSSDVQFISNPAGAAVTTSIGPACTTPCSLKFDRRDTFTAVFKLGDQEKQVFVDTEVAAGGAASMAGNVLAGGVIGIGIDAATGAGLNHVPNPVVVTFDPEPVAPAVAPTPEATATTEDASDDTPAATTTDGEFNWES